MTSLVHKAILGAFVGIFIVGLWLRGEHHARRVQTNEILLRAAIAVGNANAETARNQAALAKRIDAVAAVNALKRRETRQLSDLRRKAIIHAPYDADGPLAPVLRDQLDRLPEPASPDSRDHNAPAGTSGSPASPR